jgi:uncharacterized protein (UPF0335 family)
MKKQVNQQAAENKMKQKTKATVVDNNRLLAIIKKIEALEEEIIRLQIKGIV